jgi:3-phenylpropionate/trans-cinnamate dioxygenase ferredoxin component
MSKIALHCAVIIISMLNRLFKNEDDAPKGEPKREDGFTPVAKLADLAPGRLRRFMVERQAVVLTLAGDSGAEPVAFNALCPHALGDLSQGWVHKGEVDCPSHGYRFDLRSGACAYPRGGPSMRVYPVKLEDGVVLVKVDKPKWMDGE